MSVRLRLTFEDAQAFEAEFRKNLSKGGALIDTSADLELREVVEVALELEFCGEHRVLEAEVVHAVPGHTVAVQFLRDTELLREELGAFTGGDAAPEILELEEEESFDTGANAFGEVDLDDGAGDDEISIAGADELDERVELSEEGLGDILTDLENEDSVDVVDAEPTPDPEWGDFESSDFEGEGWSAGNAAADADDPLADIDDRRRSQRSTARMPARLESANFSLGGRTRDLSETGVLVSADGSEFPIGREISLELQHPETGETIEVSGVVSRHIEGEGTVAAVGINFEPEDEQREHLQEFIGDAKRVEAERAASGINGRIEEIGLANLIQMLSGSSEIGTLTAQQGSEEAIFAFDSGSIRYVRLGALRGIKALARMLTWSEGTFDFHAHVDPLDDEDDPMPLVNAILEAATHLDEAARPELRRFGAKTRFQVDLALARELELSQLEQAVLELAMPGLTLRRIVDVIPERDALVLETVRKLAERGVIAAAEG